MRVCSEGNEGRMGRIEELNCNHVSLLDKCTIQCRLYIKRLASICKLFLEASFNHTSKWGGGANDTFDRIPRFFGKRYYIPN